MNKRILLFLAISALSGSLYGMNGASTTTKISTEPSHALTFALVGLAPLPAYRVCTLMNKSIKKGQFGKAFTTYIRSFGTGTLMIGCALKSVPKDTNPAGAASLALVTGACLIAAPTVTGTADLVRHVAIPTTTHAFEQVKNFTTEHPDHVAHIGAYALAGALIAKLI